jgi:hypothetical protein
VPLDASSITDDVRDQNLAAEQLTHEERSDVAVALAREEWSVIESDEEGIWWSAIVARR